MQTCEPFQKPVDYAALYLNLFHHSDYQFRIASCVCIFLHNAHIPSDMFRNRNTDSLNLGSHLLQQQPAIDHGSSEVQSKQVCFHHLLIQARAGKATEIVTIFPDTSTPLSIETSTGTKS